MSTKRVETFLKKCGLYYGDINIEEVCALFLEEMNAGLAGRESSLAMIPTYIEPAKTLPANDPVIALDAGGTHFRAAVISFDGNGKPAIEGLRKRAMPGIDEEISREEFFDTLTEYIEDIVEASNRIGFCFSYPCDQGCHSKPFQTVMKSLQGKIGPGYPVC